MSLFLISAAIAGAATLVFNEYVKDRFGWGWGFAVMAIELVVAVALLAYGLGAS